MNLLSLIVAGLALWRLCALIAYEEGPFGIFFRLRRRLGVIHEVDERPYKFVHADGAEEIVFGSSISVVDHQKGNLQRGITCVWCLSIWLSPIAWYIVTDPWRYSHPRAILDMLAISSVAIVTERIVKR